MPPRGSRAQARRDFSPSRRRATARTRPGCCDSLISKRIRQQSDASPSPHLSKPGGLTSRIPPRLFLHRCGSTCWHERRSSKDPPPSDHSNSGLLQYGLPVPELRFRILCGAYPYLYPYASCCVSHSLPAVVAPLIAKRRLRHRMRHRHPCPRILMGSLLRQRRRMTHQERSLQPFLNRNYRRCLPLGKRKSILQR